MHPAPPFVITDVNKAVLKTVKCGLHSRQLISRYFAFFLAPLGSLCRFSAHTGALVRGQDGGILGSFAYYYYYFLMEKKKLRSKNTRSKTKANTHPPSQRSRLYGDKLFQERASLSQQSQLWQAYI